MIYKVFIDDSGSKDYLDTFSREHQVNPPEHGEDRDFWYRNYFVLCGLRVKQENIDAINKDIDELKKNTFGTTSIEIKSVWLRNSHKREKYYKKPFELSDKELNAFGEAVIDLIPKYKNELKIISTIFDKRCYGDQKRKTSEGTPLLKSAQVLMEKVHYRGSYNVLVFDQMEDNLRKTYGKHGQIIGVHQTNDGMENIYVERYDNITDIVFMESKKENLLQLADLCAYTIYRQFVEYGGEWGGDKKNSSGEVNLSTYDYFNKIRCNFAFNFFTRKVNGIGLTCIPDSKKINWGFLEGC